MAVLNGGYLVWLFFTSQLDIVKKGGREMTIQKIYVLTHSGRKTSGHGETAPYTNIASKDGYEFKPHPVFRSRQNAEEYCAKWKKEHYIAPSITELDLI